MVAVTRPRAVVRPRGAHPPAEVYPPVGADELSRLDPNRIGVVFIHGIGTQPACETLLDWSAPVVSLLSDWRREHGYGEDPVVRCTYDFSGASLPILELAVPEHEGHAAQTWVVTEAWWAAVTRPPTVAAMTAYISRALPRIMKGIQDGYDVRQTAERRQLALAARSAAKAADPAPDAGLVEATDSRWWGWIDWLDRVQKRLTVFAFGPALVLGTAVLAIYAPFRAIPIKTIQDLALLKSADNFLTRWFGELPDILDDPVQAANVRFRLVNAIRGMRKEGCGRIVVVAHSGGAIVSFTTLLDPIYLDERVDKLVTLGEGLALAWRIQDAWKALPPGSRLTGNLTELRPDLRWADFWSSYDPAPGGPLRPPPAVQLRNMTNATVNRMSLLEDHGAYWENDEEFLMPLLRHLDTPSGVASESRFYTDLDRRAVRSQRRRQRVAVLALWRWIVTLAVAVPLLVGTVAAFLGRAQGPERLGAAISRAWHTVPGHEIVAGPVDAIAHAAAWPDWPRLLGQWLLAAALLVIVNMILLRIGVGQWSRWDRAERRAARLRVLTPVSRRGAAFAFLVLTVLAIGLAAVVTAYFLG